MIPIELKKRYPHSRVEDITDAFMRGYQARADAVQGGDAEMDNCQVQAPQNYMQQSRHDDGKDLISRADAIEEISKGVWNVHELIDRFKALPSAEANWIPCSERLPSMRTEVIYSFDGIVSTGYMTDRDFNGEKMELHWEDLESGATIEPIAWMPLPKPYREENEE